MNYKYIIHNKQINTIKQLSLLEKNLEIEYISCPHLLIILSHSAGKL